jgi:aminoglycoside N3'-acetyltransferase
VFQRFCLLLLIIHGELERVQQDKSDDFLKQLNVYSEVVSIKQTIAMNKFQPSEITALYLDDEVAKTNKLQQFINLVVTFAVLKLKSPEEPEVTQPSHRF